MISKVNLSHADIDIAAQKLAVDLEKTYGTPIPLLKVYAIPRGGVLAAYAVMKYYSMNLVSDPEQADCFIDDLIDSGATMERYCDQYTERPFFVLFEKQDKRFMDSWLIFPWEKGEDAEETITDNFVRILQYIGEDPNREGLLETPERATKAWEFWTKGYAEKPGDVLKLFKDGASGYDEMVIVKDIPFYSKCEHHMADIFGTATIAYIPDGSIVGLSKISRLLDVYARRLQVQERLTSQVAQAMDDFLEPKGVGVVIKARHMCMESRGICQQGHYTITSALRGVLKNDSSARAEFMELAK